MAFSPQLDGTVTLGGTDYSDEITMTMFRDAAETIDVPGTFGDPDIGHKAGGARYTCELTVFSNPADSAGVWEELYGATATASRELAITARFEDGAIGASNPEYRATLLVTELGTGGEVNQGRTQTITLPCTARPTRHTS